MTFVVFILTNVVYLCYKKYAMTKAYSISNESVSYDTVNDQDVAYLIDTVRKGVQFSLFKNIISHSPFSLSEWSKFLHLSERTMQRYKKEKKTFDALQSEKILQITLLYKRGIEVFGTPEKFNSWLDSKNLVLGNIAPKNLLDNSFGIHLLEEELTRIEHGVLA